MADLDDSPGSHNDEGIPSAPTVLKTTHHSVELTWGPSTHVGKPGRPQYHVNEETCGIVYRGYSTYHVFTGLNALTTYKYSVRTSSNDGTGPWSSVTTVTTNRQPKTCENLHKAINRGDLNSIKAILDDNPNYVDIPDTYGSSPLMGACSQNKNEIASLLLDMGASVEYCNSSGKTSLMVACYFGNTEAAKLLSSRGASLTARDLSGFSAIHYAADGGHPSAVTYILAQGVNVDDVSDSTLSGWTPLMRTATLGGNVEVARVLVEAGADVNKRDKDGKTPLMLASLNGYKDLVQLLMFSGANPLVKNEYGKGAKDFAESFNRQDISELLEPKEK